MTGLPPVAPTAEFTQRARLPRDYYLRVTGNDHSVNPAVIGRMVDRCPCRPGHRHRPLCRRGRGLSPACLDPPPHHHRPRAPAAARLRASLGRTPRTVAGMGPPPARDDELAGLVRDLTDYDTRFDVNFEPTGDGPRHEHAQGVDARLAQQARQCSHLSRQGA
jgi:hypothetical protein